ncbi:MAG: Trp biosynthesis-associated membrane protein, partial [Kutzneria sp.]|nr:Trp biosynthesis-associated membrane protein [Kutzneria sp.]
VAALVPLAVVSLSLVAAVVATGGWPRRLVGVVVAMVGCGAMVASVDGVGELLGGRPEGYPVATVVAGHVLAAAAGLLLLTAGVALAASGHRMPRLGARYRTPASATAAVDPDQRLWRSLDAGRDPTVE